MPVYVPDTTSAQTNSGFLGEPANVNEKTLVPENRVVKDADSALSICDSLVYAWQKGIYNTARITAKCNGERPWGKKQLMSKGKGYKRNISTRFLQQQCAKVAPRFYMPLKQASTLTAASLPEGWPDGPVKTEKFRKRITRTIRAWPKWDYFIEGLANEITKFGLVYATWFDQYDWRPHLIRTDKGFVPQGTEILDPDIQFYCVKWQYHPSKLLELLKANIDSGRSEWKKDSCVAAINKATPPPVGPTFDKWRDYEDLLRQSVWSIAYYKAMRLIDTYHLFALEPTGKVSHYIIWRDGTKTGQDNDTDNRLLYECLDEYDSISDVTVPVPFGYGDGSLQGAWGVGQLLFDMSNQVEIARNEAMDAQSAQGKLKLVVAEGKNVNDVVLTVNDEMMTVSNAQFAQPGAATPANDKGFKLLDDEFTMWAMQIVGNYVPPIPLQPSDTKAAAINTAQAQESEVQNNNLQNFLKHVAYIIQGITNRLCDKTNPDEVAKEVYKALLEEDQLTDEEIGLLVDQPTVQTVIDFTPAQAAARAQFAASRFQNPVTAGLYQPRKLEEIQAAAVPGGKSVIDFAMVPEADKTMEVTGQHEQTIENAVLADGTDVPILANHNDLVHLTTMKQPMEQVIAAGTPQGVAAATAGLRHAGAHLAAGTAKKILGADGPNAWKQWLANMEKALQAVQQRLAQQQMQQQAAGSVPGSAPVQPQPIQ